VEEEKYKAAAKEEKDKSEAAAKGASADKPSSAPTASDRVTAVPASAPASSSRGTTKARSPTRSPTHAFAPDLPSLPTPSASVLPSNRKRKTPKDFSPSGPNDVPTPTSPSKNSVKFEDGIAPGEGKQGEKIIPAPAVVAKNRNAVERTIWTFIMIGGFITLLCLGHPYMILLVLLCQTLVYKEVTALFELRDQKKTAEDPWSKTLNWYVFTFSTCIVHVRVADVKGTFSSSPITSSTANR
jgi:phosphatidate cytidylyltransferase